MASLIDSRQMSARAQAPVLPEPPGIFPFLSKEGMQEALPRANEPIVRSAKAQEHAPPTRLLPLRRSPSSQSADQQTVLAVKPAGHSAGAPVASGPEYLPIRCRQARGNRLLLYRDHRHELDPFRGTGCESL